ncbi:MAG: hypothetical protein FWF50_01655 [Defluviitaleaceae bacterium]|nr:hypothetical protein [Defluviitaleaceae bacterium]
MTQEKIIHTLGKHEEQLASLRGEVTSIRSLTEQIYELTASMKVLATKIDKQHTTIERFGKRLGELETAPNNRLRSKVDTILKYLIIFVLTTLMGYIFTRIGMNF